MGIQPKERSLQTRLLIHVHHKQMVLKKRTPTDSAVLLGSLDRYAPHSLSQTKAQIKNKHGRSNISEEREEAEGDEVKERLKEGGEG